MFTTCGLMVQDPVGREARPEASRFSQEDFSISRDDSRRYWICPIQPRKKRWEVLFALLAERYERGSVVLTSNLPFSGWESIFKDPMTTAAAIDRLVHHSVIIELNVPSYRVEQAKKRQSSHQTKESRKEE